MTLEIPRYGGRCGDCGNDIFQEDMGLDCVKCGCPPSKEDIQDMLQDSRNIDDVWEGGGVYVNTWATPSMSGVSFEYKRINTVGEMVRWMDWYAGSGGRRNLSNYRLSYYRFIPEGQYTPRLLETLGEA